MQPVLDRLGLDLVQAQLASARHNLLVQVNFSFTCVGLAILTTSPNKATPVVATLSNAPSTIGT